jgi:two-component system response regulator HydG
VGAFCVPVRSVLAVGAHPDDIVLGIGGSLVHFGSAGFDVTFLCLTSGELGGNATDREHEEIEAARSLGASVLFGRLEDGNISQREAIGLIADCVRRLRPTMVFAHDPSDTHQDHVHTGHAATVACRMVPNLFFYEGPSSVAFEPTTVLDVSAVWHRKLQALSAYKSQMDARELMGWVESVSRFRAWPRHVGARCETMRVGHAELSLAATSETHFTSRPVLAREA